MTHRKLKKTACLLAVLLCLTLCACDIEEQPQQTETTAATQGYKPILPATTKPRTESMGYTPVYVSVFEDTAILATIPLEEWDGKEPECPAREISQGGWIACNGEHERETPIKKVIIVENLVPRATNDWFRDLVWLESIQGMGNLQIQHVTDMSHMFSGCEKLSELDIGGWDVSNVEDMTGMFDGCDALGQKPEWYTAED